jgi:hypothetical protein
MLRLAPAARAWVSSEGSCSAADGLRLSKVSGLATAHGLVLAGAEAFGLCESTNAYPRIEGRGSCGCAGAAGSSSGIVPLRRDFASNAEVNSSRTSGTTRRTLLCRDLASPFEADSQRSAGRAVVPLLCCALASHAGLKSQQKPLARARAPLTPPPQCRGKR